jgi:hypothetical protein
VNTVWIVVGLAVVGVVIALVTAWQRRDPHADLGAVSNQWISEHRVDQGHNHRL